MALTVRELDQYAAPGLAATWQRLAEATPGASVFQSAEWVQSWGETVGAARRPLVLLVEEAREPIGLLAGCRAGRRLELAGGAGVSGDHLGALCRTEDEARVITALLEHIEAEAGCDALAFTALDDEGPLLARLRDRAAERGWTVTERPAEVLPYVDLPDTWEAFVAGLSANMRYHVRRRRRAFDAQADSAVCVARASDEVAAALERLFDLHARRWQRDHRAGNFGNPQKRAFLHAFCRRAAERGWTRAWRLEAGGQTVGVLLAFHYGRTASFYQMGWDPAAPIASPGVVLLAASIAGAIGEGLRCYDFLRGDEEYKRRWTKHARRQITFAAAWGTAARAALAAERFTDGLKYRVKSALGPVGWAQIKRLTGVP